jgi:branched-chain amino acid transport system ATP-binding protein
MTPPLLQIDGLTKRFGGVIAADTITLDIPAGEFHAVIGPNGAGKTTLTGLLTGEIKPDGGRVRFDGGDITALAVDRRSHLGLARSFQITSLFDDFTALDNVALAVQAHSGHSFRFWHHARRDPRLCEPALAALDRVGLGSRARKCASMRSVTASTASSRSPWRWRRGRGCSCSTSRWPAWAPTNPRAWWRWLRALKGSLIVVLIEHDMEAVFALADRITVLVYGRVIASGAPAAIRADVAVREAYLGEQEATDGRSRNG